MAGVIPVPSRNPVCVAAIVVRVVDGTRDAVVFVARDGTAISPVDIGREIRAWAFVQHELVQRADRSCWLVMRPLLGERMDTDAVQERLEQLFGEGTPVELILDERLGEDRPGGKVVPFRGDATLPA